ncbi:Gag-Pol poly, partial [Emericellopsis cladophorae]
NNNDNNDNNGGGNGRGKSSNQNGQNNENKSKANAGITNAFSALAFDSNGNSENGDGTSFAFMSFNSQPFANGGITKEDFIVDSGCSTHVLNDRSYFTYLKELSRPDSMTACNGQGLQVTAIGTAEVHMTGGGTLYLREVNFAAEAAANMLSPGVLRKNGIVMDGIRDALVHKNNGTVLGEYEWKQHIAVLHVDKRQPQYNFAALPYNTTTQDVEYALMHRRLGHASKDRILKACRLAGIRIKPDSIA